MRLPDFLIIGAARCGTTSLYEYLKEHPDIYLPEEKRPEPHFFLKQKEFNKGLEYYSKKYFSQASATEKAGEASTSYIYQPYVAKRIHAALPDVKLIVMLRNPVERAFSSYITTKSNGLEKLDFSTAIRQENERINNPESEIFAEIQPFAYLGRGFYYKQLKEYLRYFSRKQIHITLFEDFIHAPLPQIQKIFAFLDVDHAFQPSNINTIYNKSAYEQPPISQEDRLYMLSVFQQDIADLSQLLNKDFSHWTKANA